LEKVFYIIPILLFSVVVHEYAHGYVAYRWGDPTAAVMGRLTLNPVPHIDPIGSLLVPILMAATGGLLFGWARPVPVNPDNYRNRKWGDITVSLAGPASNVILAFLFTGLWIVALKLLGPELATGPLNQVFATGITLNLILAAFNLLPIPPLDGSHVLANFLPRKLAYNYMSLARFGFLILIVLLVFPPFRALLSLIYVPVQIVAGLLFDLVGRVA
jgi:Zn-dependent protease